MPAPSWRRRSFTALISEPHREWPENLASADLGLRRRPDALHGGTQQGSLMLLCALAIFGGSSCNYATDSTLDSS